MHTKTVKIYGKEEKLLRVVNVLRSAKIDLSN